jgi:hypothetical protein
VLDGLLFPRRQSGPSPRAGRDVLPNLVVVGAPRCGTTTLWAWLDEHPKVAMSRPKELRFFDNNWSNGLGWYDAHFSDAPIRGEASPQYMYDEVAMDRMARTIPDARLIAVLRNPIDRAYSAFWMERTNLREQRPFAEAADGYLPWGRYVGHLVAVCEHYPREALLVLILEELQANPVHGLHDVWRFLDVDDDVIPVSGRQHAYRGFRSSRLQALAMRLRRSCSLLREGASPSQHACSVFLLSDGS